MRLVSLVLAFLIICGVAYASQDSTETRLVALEDGTTASITLTPQQAKMCLPEPTKMDRLTELASDIGGIVPTLNGPIQYGRIAENVQGAIWTAGFLGGTAAAAADGRPAPQKATTPVDCKALLNPCVASGSTAPANPKVANLQGADLAADALTKAAPNDAKWLSQIPLGVSIASYESSFIPTASNDVGSGHVGLWQISGANAAVLKLGDRTDPYVNAKYAYAIWQGRGGTWSQDWTVYDTALGDQDKYARFGPQQASPLVAAAASAPAPVKPDLSQDPEVSVPDTGCDEASGALGVSIGTWNTAGKIGNTPARINKGAPFADVVGLQEVSNNKALDRIPGYGVTPGRMAVPIIWRKSKVSLIEWKREDSLNGYAKDKSVVWAVFESLGGGRFAVVNTHQLVEGGKGWQVQASYVDRVRKRLQRQGLKTIVVGDMNASTTAVQGAFGSAGVGGRIDRIIGPKAGEAQQLSAEGSDHHRYRVSYPAAPAAAVDGNLADPGGKTYNLGPVKPQAAKVANLIGHKFDLKVIGGYRPNDPYPDHPSGRALDLMVYGDHAKGQAIANYAQANAEALKVDYLIWDQHIWSTGRAGEGWRSMADRGNPTANHKDHVHLMVRP